MSVVGLRMDEPSRLLLLASLLASDRLISNNGKAFLKEMILRRDPRLETLLSRFESKDVVDAAFMEQVHEIIRKSYKFSTPFPIPFANHHTNLS